MSADVQIHRTDRNSGESHSIEFQLFQGFSELKVSVIVFEGYIIVANA